jgi:phage gpG-like protein
MVEDHDLGYNAILTAIDELSGKSIKVGVLGTSGKASDGKASLVDVAVYNEYGTSRIPKRPFMRIAADKNKQRWQGLSDKLTDRIIDGGISAGQSLEIIGNKMVGDIQLVLGSSELVPNAVSTVKKKGSAAPLIDTGRLRQSISFKIEG